MASLPFTKGIDHANRCVDRPRVAPKKNAPAFSGAHFDDVIILVNLDLTKIAPGIGYVRLLYGDREGEV